MAQTPDVWGLRCPEGTGQGERSGLTDLRLRRIADVQKPRQKKQCQIVRSGIQIPGSTLGSVEPWGGTLTFHSRLSCRL